MESWSGSSRSCPALTHIAGSRGGNPRIRAARHRDQPRAPAGERKRDGGQQHQLPAAAYGSGKFLHWVIGSGITPHIPVWNMSKREEGILSRADFTFDRQRNLYICPQGKILRTTGTVQIRSVRGTIRVQMNT